MTGGRPSDEPPEPDAVLAVEPVSAVTLVCRRQPGEPSWSQRWTGETGAPVTNCSSSPRGVRPRVPSRENGRGRGRRCADGRGDGRRRSRGCAAGGAGVARLPPQFPLSGGAFAVGRSWGHDDRLQYRAARRVARHDKTSLLIFRDLALLRHQTFPPRARIRATAASDTDRVHRLDALGSQGEPDMAAFTGQPVALALHVGVEAALAAPVRVRDVMAEAGLSAVSWQCADMLLLMHGRGRPCGSAGAAYCGCHVMWP